MNHFNLDNPCERDVNIRFVGFACVAIRYSPYRESISCRMYPQKTHVAQIYGHNPTYIKCTEFKNSDHFAKLASSFFDKLRFHPCTVLLPIEDAAVTRAEMAGSCYKENHNGLHRGQSELSFRARKDLGTEWQSNISLFLMLQ